MQIESSATETSPTTADDDAAFLRAFEACTLSPFHHRDHLRVAWLYLRRFSFAEAALRFVEGVKRFAAARGAHDRYHETITWAYLALVNERMHGMHDGRERTFDAFERATFDAFERATFDAFERANDDLFDHRTGALCQMYDARTLESERARVVFVLPRKRG